MDTIQEKIETIDVDEIHLRQSTINLEQKYNQNMESEIMDTQKMESQRIESHR